MVCYTVYSFQRKICTFYTLGSLCSKIVSMLKPDNISSREEDNVIPLSLALIGFINVALRLKHTLFFFS